MNENSITAKVIKVINSIPGAFCRKRHGSAYTSGDPDIAGVFRGRAFFIEMKLVGGKLSELQADMLDRWSSAGAATAVGIYAPADKVLHLIEMGKCGGKWERWAGAIDKVVAARFSLKIRKEDLEEWLLKVSIS